MLSFSKYVKNFFWPSLPYTQLDWYNRSLGRELQLSGLLKGYDYHNEGVAQGAGTKSHLTSPTSRLSLHKALILKPIYSAYYIYTHNERGIVKHHFNPLALLDPRRFIDMSFEFLHGACDLLAHVDHNPNKELKTVRGKLDWANRSGISRFFLGVSAVIRFPISLAQTVWNTFAHPFDTHLKPYVQLYNAYQVNKTLPAQQKVSNGKLAALAVLHTLKTGLVIACIASVVGKPFIPAVTGFFSSVANYVTGGVLGKVAEAAAAQVVSSYTAPVIAQAVVAVTGAQLVSNTLIPRTGVKLRDQVRERFNHDMTSRVERGNPDTDPGQSSVQPPSPETARTTRPYRVVTFLRQARLRTGNAGFRRLDDKMPAPEVKLSNAFGCDGVTKYR